MNEKTVANWITLSAYDMETAHAMHKAGRYLYVAFTCHQTIEKMLKALFVSIKAETPPYTHNLIKLCENAGLIGSMGPARLATVDELNSFYIQSRYSEEVEKISRLIDHRRSEEIIGKTGELRTWLQEKIGKP